MAKTTTDPEVLKNDQGDTVDVNGRIIHTPNVKFAKSPNVYGYGNFIGDEAWVDPKAEILVNSLDSEKKEIEGKFEKANALEYFLETGICKKV